MMILTSRISLSLPTAYLKRQSEGYKPKKSKILTEENVETFINIAPNEMYLSTKVSIEMQHMKNENK